MFQLPLFPATDDCFCNRSSNCNTLRWISERNFIVTVGFFCLYYSVFLGFVSVHLLLHYTPSLAAFCSSPSTLPPVQVVVHYVMLLLFLSLLCICHNLYRQHSGHSYNGGNLLHCSILGADARVSFYTTSNTGFLHSPTILSYMAISLTSKTLQRSLFVLLHYFIVPICYLYYFW